MRRLRRLLVHNTSQRQAAECVMRQRETRGVLLRSRCIACLNSDSAVGACEVNLVVGDSKLACSQLRHSWSGRIFSKKFSKMGLADIHPENLLPILVATAIVGGLAVSWP